MTEENTGTRVRTCPGRHRHIHTCSRTPTNVHICIFAYLQPAIHTRQPPPLYTESHTNHSGAYSVALSPQKPHIHPYLPPCLPYAYRFVFACACAYGCMRACVCVLVCASTSDIHKDFHLLTLMRKRYDSMLTFACISSRALTSSRYGTDPEEELRESVCKDPGGCW
jgi:hypothetical protein